MSIIHDALKKVQQQLTPPSPKTDDIQIQTPTTDEEPVEYLDSTAPIAPPKPKPPIKNKIQSMYVVTCTVLITLAVTIASGTYIYQQCQNDIPKVQNLAKKSFDKLIHKKELPEFKPLAPPPLKSLAQLTVNPATTKTPSPTKLEPITLDIHGIMANASGNLVLINDQVYQEGDEIDGTKIVKINLDSITVLNNGTEQTIPVKD